MSSSATTPKKVTETKKSTPSTTTTTTTPKAGLPKPAGNKVEPKKAVASKDVPKSPASKATGTASVQPKAVKDGNDVTPERKRPRKLTRPTDTTPLKNSNPSVATMNKSKDDDDDVLVLRHGPQSETSATKPVESKQAAPVSKQAAPVNKKTMPPKPVSKQQPGTAKKVGTVAAGVTNAAVSGATGVVNTTSRIATGAAGGLVDGTTSVLGYGANKTLPEGMEFIIQT
jgi:hypothetical protein